MIANGSGRDGFGGRIAWPEGKAFAFTAFDDTDEATVANVGPVYDFLADLGFRTTKSVWPLRAPEAPASEGQTCEDPDYLDWALKLQARGFEIGLHCVASRTSDRERTLRGLRAFREAFGPEPITYSNHLVNEEGIYYGPYRLSGLRRAAYRLFALRNHGGARFRGHVEGDPLFWGDACQEYVKYVRNFSFADINTLKECPYMPYHDPGKPYVDYWFASSEGGDLPDFCRTIAEDAQDRLEAEGGACIMYTHFVAGFHDGKRIDPRFEALMRRLAGKNGWFVPVRTLLDYLIETRGRVELGAADRRRLEWRWLRHKAKHNRS
jgi:hypothetical protein